MPDSDVSGLLEHAAIQDPSITGAHAEQIARRCLAIYAERAVDAPELARRCVAELPNADASWVAHIARAIVASRGGDYGKRDG
jgi:hypothetical protein